MTLPFALSLPASPRLGPAAVEPVPGSAAGSAARLLAACAAALLLAAALPAAAALDVPEKAELAAHLDRTAYAPGETARLAAVLDIDHGWHVNAHQPTYDYLIPTELTLHLPEGWGEPAIAYPDAVVRAFSFADDPLDVYEGRAVMVATVPVPADAAAGPVPVVAEVRYQACDDRSCLPPVTVERELELVVGPGGAPQNQAVFGGGGEAGAGGALPGAGNLALMLLLGVVGGLILNVMPCVLPVLSLKVFGLVKAAGIGRREVVVGSLATTAGILVSFWALALFAVGARAAGAAVGWGVQFQQPGFVTFLAVVVVLFCLNLWGLFEIPLPGRLASLGAGGAGEPTLAGHFGSGLFATLMATPCSAPFLGTAVGFALAQSWPVILAIFTAVGLGMALPYLALAVAPGAARLLPKPGAWMETLKKLMGFFLAAAAVWLLYVLAGQVTPERLAAIELGLLALALFVWARSRVTRRGVLRHATAAGVVGAAALAMVLAVSAQAGAGTVAGNGAAAQKLIPWVEFDRAAAEQMAAGGQLVFVDVTADWCFTCKTNERLVLETADVAALFEQHGVVPMKADWTNRDDAIAAFLADHGRYSIPFYLLYRPGAEPHVFSELLTKNAVREAVEAAAGR